MFSVGRLKVFTTIALVLARSFLFSFACFSVLKVWAAGQGYFGTGATTKTTCFQTVGLLKIQSEKKMIHPLVTKCTPRAPEPCTKFVLGLAS